MLPHTTRTHTHTCHAYTYIHKGDKTCNKEGKNKVEVWKAIEIKVSDKGKWESRQRYLEYFNMVSDI